MDKLTAEEAAIFAKVGITSDADIAALKERIISDKKEICLKEINERYNALIRAKNDEISALNALRNDEIAALG